MKSSERSLERLKRSMMLLNEEDVSILKELLFRIDPSLFREFIQYELSCKYKNSGDLRYELLRKLDDAGKRFQDKRNKIKDLIESI
jgi:hypothetical protein